MPWWRHLWQCYANPFNLLLTGLATVSYYTEDMKATIVISTMVILSTVLRFVQETRSNNAADALKAMVGNKATVMRRDLTDEAADEAEQYFAVALNRKPPHQADIAIVDLVPGDIVVLSAGDMIPADLRALSAKDLFISQAAMTGESLPVEKFAEAKTLGSNALDRENLLFMGTNVVSGSGIAVVLETGPRTYFGALAQKVMAADRAPTAFQVGVNRVSWLLIRFMFVMVPLVFLLNGFTKGDWLEAFLFAMSVAVGLTPEMLPMIVTSTLAKGAVVLSRKKVIVKRLDAIQNFGAMNVLCTDKTGTLTQDRIFLERHIGIDGEESDDVLKLRVSQQLLPDRPEEPARRGRARTRRGAARAEPGDELPQGRRDSVRFRAAPHVGGRLRARGPPRADLQGSARGSAGGVHVHPRHQARPASN